MKDTLPEHAAAGHDAGQPPGSDIETEVQPVDLTEANYELPRLNWQYRLQDPSTLEFWRARCGDGVEDSQFAAQIIQFPDL